jgi:hypothetical protein
MKDIIFGYDIYKNKNKEVVAVRSLMPGNFETTVEIFLEVNKR